MKEIIQQLRESHAWKHYKDECIGDIVRTAPRGREVPKTHGISSNAASPGFIMPATLQLSRLQKAGTGMNAKA